MQGPTNRGKSVETIRGYSIFEWTGPSVDDGSMKKFSVGPRGSFSDKRFDTLEEAKHHALTAPTLRKVRVEFEAYVPEFEIPDRPKKVVPVPFELTPPPEEDPIVCANCGAYLHLANGIYLDEDDADQCDDGKRVHSPYRHATEEEIEEWIRFELHGGSISNDNPLVKHGLDVIDVYISDISEVK